MQFAALDFETATPARDSACALGVCIVENGQVAREESWLIRPPNNEYGLFQTQVHGLGPADTESAPPFGEVIDQAWSLIGDLPLVAHNASFDMSVLRHCLDSCGRQYPEVHYYCTLILARAHWPELPSYSLPIVLAHCGLTHRHHDAAEDATASAQILLQVAQDTRTDNLPRLADGYGICPGQLYDWGYAPCGSPMARRRSQEILKVSEITVREDADPGHLFFDTDVAFTGTLVSMSRFEAMQLVADRGGRPRTSVSKRTEYLVIGTVEYRSLLTGEPSGKLRKAMELREAGARVVLMSEREFLESL